MKNFPLVYIVLLNYKNYKDTIECIKSLEKINYPNYKIVVVDNNSQNGSVEIIKSEKPLCTVISNFKNNGFAGGNNVGIKFSLKKNADYVCLLNNDTVVDKNYLTHLVITGESADNIGIVGGEIRYYSDRNKIWYSGGKINPIFGKATHITRRHYRAKIEKTMFITGCLQLIKSDVFKKVGLLPEQYFIYYEDLDYCMAVHKAGYKLIINRESIVFHKCGKTASYKSPISIYYSNRNILIFIKKHYNGLMKMFFIFTNICADILKLIIYRGNQRKSIIEALKFNIKNGL